MGTRSLTIVKEDKKDLLTIYRQMDGYPTGHGKELKEFLESRVLCNGIGGSPGKGLTLANGMGCLAAQLVAVLKSDNGQCTPGSIYIYPNGSKDCGEDYLYIISGEIGRDFSLKVYARGVGSKCNRIIFDGPVGLFSPVEVEAKK